MNKEYTGEQVFSEMLNMLETRLADAQSELAYAEAKKRVIEDMIDEVRMILNHEIVV